MKVKPIQSLVRPSAQTESVQDKNKKQKPENEENFVSPIQERYNPASFEKKWQKVWKEQETYKFRLNKQEKKYYPLVEFPYPSGNLHIGHWFSFTTADVHARLKKMQGNNVFFTNGFDAFGLPAENAAIKHNVHPQDWTMGNIDTMTKQFETMGTMIDWSHRVIACLPEYYRWNQWIFLKMFEKGLAYRGKALSNWCPVDQTVLANEHVENGKCWRCGAEVQQKEIEQWFLKITEYADRLEWNNDGNGIDWPKSVMVAQNEWIGKKEGMKITHHVVGLDLSFETFTAYPAWSWADTFIVIAPEHPLVKELAKGTPHEKDVMGFVAETAKKSELERKETTEKLGIFTGRYAKDPFGGPDMPIWLANFALMNFGTGIIRCSGHDERDIAFAKKYSIPTKEVVEKRSSGEAATPHDGQGGVLENSGPFTGRDVNKVRKEVINWIEQQGIGKRFTNYHLHDWSVSRQRYWGTPVPMIHCEKCGIVPVPEKDLPVTLPYNVDFTPKGEPPLASNKEWLNVTCPKCEGAAQRDPETLDTFFDSSWYFYRYIDPQYDKAPFDKEQVKELLPVDIYFGGAEHTLGHTLYARFFTKFFKDIGLVDFDEFAKKRVQHGVILGPDGNRMSKSKGNIVNPDDVIGEYGADTVRMYLCFMMPYESTAPWDPKGIWGVYKFLKKVWDLQYHIDSTEDTLSKEDLHDMHKAIKKVGEDISATKFNTAVSSLMIWLNHLEDKGQKIKGLVSHQEYEILLKLVAPFAPHMTEELYQRTKQHSSTSFVSIHKQSWPEFDNAYLVADNVTIVVQVNGKVRDNIVMQATESESQENVEAQARASEKVNKHLEGKSVKKIIYVPGKIVNFVAN